MYSPYSQDAMHAFAYAPENSSSSPDGFYYAKMQDNLTPWSFFHPPHPSSKASRPMATVNPRTIIPQFQTPCTSDVDTPSSASSYSIPTPLSPFMQLYLREEELDRDEFEYDDDEDDDGVDSDFLTDVEMTDEDPCQIIPLNGLSAPQAIKSAVREVRSETAEPFDGLHGGDYDPSVRVISDRKMSASAPGYPTTPHHPLADENEQLQRWLQKAQPSDPVPSQYSYSHIEFSPSQVLSAPALPAALHQQSYTFITSTDPYNASGSIPIMQPQPIRPIPHIPINDFTSTNNDCGRSASCAQALSPLPLLCQPVSDAVRYQLQAGQAVDDDPECYDDADPSEGVCENLILADATEPFQCEGSHSVRRATDGVMCGCEGMISWH